jgi:hypothetical protein
VSLKVITAMYGSHLHVGALLKERGNGGAGYAAQTSGPAEISCYSISNQGSARPAAERGPGVPVDPITSSWTR